MQKLKQVRFGPLARVRLDRVVTVVDAAWITWHRGALFSRGFSGKGGKGLCHPLMFDAKAARVVAEGHQWEEAQELRPLTSLISFDTRHSTQVISHNLRYPWSHMAYGVVLQPVFRLFTSQGQDGGSHEDQLQLIQLSVADLVLLNKAWSIAGEGRDEKKMRLRITS